MSYQILSATVTARPNIEWAHCEMKAWGLFVTGCMPMPSSHWLPLKGCWRLL